MVTAGRTRKCSVATCRCNSKFHVGGGWDHVVLVSCSISVFCAKRQTFKHYEGNIHSNDTLICG